MSWPILHQACARGMPQSLKALLTTELSDWKIPVTVGNHQAMSAAHLAACSNSVDCLAVLLDNAGPQIIDCVDGSLATPLHYSAGLGCTSVTDWLLDNGACVNACDSAGATPLLWAAGMTNHGFCESNQSQLVQTLELF